MKAIIIVVVTNINDPLLTILFLIISELLFLFRIVAFRYFTGDMVMARSSFSGFPALSIWALKEMVNAPLSRW